MNVFSSSPTSFKRNQLISLCQKVNTKAKLLISSALKSIPCSLRASAVRFKALLRQSLSKWFGCFTLNRTSCWLQKFIIVVVSSCPHVLLRFLFFFWFSFFFFSGTSLETSFGEYCWLWLSNSSLRISSDIFCLLHSSSSSCIWALYCNVSESGYGHKFFDQI